ncbi:MAG: hypothetical protein AAB215_03315 [Planctomycetota bacterium]|mgnify:CR=1 FL=1
MIPVNLDPPKKRTAHYLEITWLFVLPALLVALYLQVWRVDFPYWMHGHSDPDYAYLMNSLRMAELRAPYIVEHPGTPLHALGAIVIRTMHMFSFEQDMTKDVLEQSEAYLVGINRVVMVMFLASMLGAGFLALNTTKRILPALLVQTAPFAAHACLMAPARVSPEPILLMCAIWYSAFIFMAERCDGNSRSWVLPAAFGIVSGVALATKLTFAPLLILPFFLLPDWRGRLRFIFVAISSFLFWTIPIWLEMDRMLAWIWSIMSHTEERGTGPGGLLDPVKYLEGLKGFLSRIYGNSQLFSLLLLSGAVACSAHFLKRIYRKERTRSFPLKFIGVACGVSILSILLFSKQPYIRYMVPLFGLSGVFLWYLTNWAIFQIESEAKRRTMKIVLFVLAAVVCGKSVILDYFPRRLSEMTMQMEEVKRIEQMIRDKYRGQVVVLNYESSTLAYVLFRGDRWAGKIYGKRIHAMKPDAYCCGLGMGITNGERSTSFDSFVKQHGQILFRSLPGLIEKAPFARGLTVDDVFHGKWETLYMVKPPQGGGEPRKGS